MALTVFKGPPHAGERSFAIDEHDLATVRTVASPGAGDVHAFSNDYLAIASHPEILAAQIAGLQSRRDSAWMSAVFMAPDAPMRDVEARLAQWLGTESSILTQSGYCANLGLVQCIADERTVVYADVYAHASLWEGIRSAGARGVYFEHNRPDRLEGRIQAQGPGVVIVDSIYSQDGSVCPLAEVADVARRNGCTLVVDESHSLGTHGPGGAGLVAELGLADQVHFRTASLAKAFVSRAGLVACSRAMADYIRHSARPAIFSSTLMDHDVAGIAAVLELVVREHERRTLLHDSARYLREGLRAAGFALSSASQIVSLVCGTSDVSAAMHHALQREGVFGSGFCPPATSLRGALVRFSVHAALTRTELDRIILTCSRIVDRLGVRIRCYRPAERVPHASQPCSG